MDIVFNGEIIYKWWIFHCHVWLPEGICLFYACIDSTYDIIRNINNTNTKKNKPSYKTWLAGFHAWRFVCSFLQKNMLCHWNFIGIVILHTSSSGWFSWNSLYNRLRQVRATWQSRSRVYYIGKTRKPSLIYHGCCWFNGGCFYPCGCWLYRELPSEGFDDDLYPKTWKSRITPPKVTIHHWT